MSEDTTSHKLSLESLSNGGYLGGYVGKLFDVLFDIYVGDLACC